MNDKIIDIYYFNDYDEEDFIEAFSDLRQFGVKDEELNLNYYDIEDEYSN